MEEGGTRDNREYFAAGKTIRNSQHIVDEWIEHNFPLQNRKEWGHACLGLGACCIVLSLAPLPLLNWSVEMRRVVAVMLKSLPRFGEVLRRRPIHRSRRPPLPAQWTRATADTYR